MDADRALFAAALDFHFRRERAPELVLPFAAARIGRLGAGGTRRPKQPLHKLFGLAHVETATNNLSESVDLSFGRQTQ